MTITQLNILLADDDLDDRFFFEKALKEIPIKTQLNTVQDGEQLMDYLTENSEDLPDIIFLDLSMPRKSGFECLTELRENEKFETIPVVVFSTSYSKDPNYEQGLKNILFKIGATDFIKKPSGFPQLKEVIENTLNKVIENNYNHKITQVTD